MPPTYSTSGDDEPSTLTSRLAVVVIAGMFVLNGVLIGAYGGILPALRIRLDLADSDVSVLLFVGGVAAIAAMQVGGRLADAFAPRIVVLVGSPLMALGAGSLAVAPTFLRALVAVVLLGAGGGAMDVAMNALAVQLERARRENGGGSILSSFHALWSVGHLSGAGLCITVAALFRLRGAEVLRPVLFLVAAAGAVGSIVLLVIAPRGAALPRLAPSALRRGARRVPRAAYVLGAIGLASGLAEGTASSWSSLDVTEVAHVDAAVGSLGLVAVSGCMVAVRFAADRLVDRFGRRLVMRVAGILSALGFIAVVFTHELVPLLLAWCAVGTGVGVLAPQVYGAAGHLGGGRVLATVVTFGYAGYLAGPASIGAATRHLGLAYTMFLPAVLCLLIVFLARTMPDRLPARAAEQR